MNKYPSKAVPGLTVDPCVRIHHEKESYIALGSIAGVDGKPSDLVEVEVKLRDNTAACLLPMPEGWKFIFDVIDGLEHDTLETLLSTAYTHVQELAQ